MIMKKFLSLIALMTGLTGAFMHQPLGAQTSMDAHSEPVSYTHLTLPTTRR